jgi:8-oxo-dGTP diphosphatase
MVPIHVAVAVIEDAQGRILISRRPDHLHQGGYWEFPGGKVEPGETLAGALVRELNEELGLQVTDHRPLICFTHEYPDRCVLLDVHRVTAYSGAAEGLEGQELAWVPVAELLDYSLLPADRPIATAIQLPDRYLITPEPGDVSQFLTQLEKTLKGGIRLVQLRARALPEDALRPLAKEVLQLCRQHGARLLLNEAVSLAEEMGVDGVHLTSRQLMGLEQRPLGKQCLVAASCHNASELAQAHRLGLDFVVLSPVLPTGSHPEATPLGWVGFAGLLDKVSLPAYALGGMCDDHIKTAWEHGAQGVAGITGLWER